MGLKLNIEVSTLIEVRELGATYFVRMVKPTTSQAVAMLQEVDTSNYSRL